MTKSFSRPKTLKRKCAIGFVVSILPLITSCNVAIRHIELPSNHGEMINVVNAPTVVPGFPLTLVSPVQANILSPTFSATSQSFIAIHIGGATTGGFGHVVQWAGATAFTQVAAAYFNDGWNIWGEWWIAEVSMDQANVQAEYHETTPSSGGDGIVMAVYVISGTSGVGAIGIKNDQAGLSTLSLDLPSLSAKSLVLVGTYLEDSYSQRPANTDLLPGSVEDANLIDSAGASPYNYAHAFTTESGNISVGYTTVNYNGSSGSKLAAGIELLAR